MTLIIMIIKKFKLKVSQKKKTLKKAISKSLNKEDNDKLSLKMVDILKNTKESSLEKNKEPLIRQSLYDKEELIMAENFINLMNSQSMDNVKLE